MMRSIKECLDWMNLGEEGERMEESVMMTSCKRLNEADLSKST